MTKAAEFFNRYKKIIIIAVLLTALIISAVVLFGNNNDKSLTIGSETVERTETESKLMRILSEIEGVGKAEVMISESENGVDGVVIVCEGADSLITRSNVINAVKVALNIEKSNIAIYAMN